MSEVNFTNLKADLENVQSAFAQLMNENHLSESEFNGFNDQLFYMMYEANEINEEINAETDPLTLKIEQMIEGLWEVANAEIENEVSGFQNWGGCAVPSGCDDDLKETLFNFFNSYIQREVELVQNWAKDQCKPEVGA